jgi:cardiolipin synthase
VQVYEVLPVGLFSPKSARFDLRNHRKIAVIDGKIGYTGSQNLVDARYKEDLTYEELVVRVTGPVVLELQYVFVSDWYLETEELLDRPNYFPEPQIAGKVTAQVLPSDPSFPQANIQRLIVALIHAANQRVVITTPYFIPDEPLMQALETAVLRGVEVHLVVSQKMDQRLVGLAQLSYYDALLAMGVHVHLYKYRFLHAKHVTFDDHITLIGSTNMDIRSFRLNAEVCLLCYDEGVTGRLREIQEGYFRRCIKLDRERWRRRAFVSRMIQNLARLFSPLL